MGVKPTSRGPASHATRVNIVRMRNARGMSQADLAQAISGTGHPMTGARVSTIERGDRRIDVDDLVAIARALGVTVNDLIGDGQPTDTGRTEWDAFVRMVTSFVDAVGVNRGAAVARLIRETAVAGFMRGTMWGSHRIPRDSDMQRQVMETTEQMPDIYPVWGLMRKHADAADE